MFLDQLTEQVLPRSARAAEPVQENERCGRGRSGDQIGDRASITQDNNILPDLPGIGRFRGRALDILARNPPPRTRGRYIGEVDAQFPGELARGRRGVDAAGIVPSGGACLPGRTLAVTGRAGFGSRRCGWAAATSDAISSSERASSGAAMTAIGPLTGISLPTSATILRRTPADGASTSLTAFSVSTVSSGSPSSISAPSSRSQPVTVPAVIVRPHFGILTRVGIVLDLASLRYRGATLRGWRGALALRGRGGVGRSWGGSGVPEAAEEAA